MQKPYEQLLGQQDDSKQVLIERIQRFKSSLAVVKVKKPAWWTGQWKRLYTIVEKKGGRGAPGWYGESRRHSEAAIKGARGVVAPLERGEYEKPKWWVYEGNILRAAQSTKEGAMHYMKQGRTLRKSPKRETYPMGETEKKFTRASTMMMDKVDDFSD